MTITQTLKHYNEVIADLESQAVFFDKKAMATTISVLKQRVWEFENVFADLIELERLELEASMKRHPSNSSK